MKIHDLQRSTNEGASLLGGVETAERPPSYGYGTMLTLEAPELKKLGLEAQVGDILEMGGSVKVVSVTDNDGQMTMGLQVTHLGLGGEKESDATVLYPQARSNAE